MVFIAGHRGARDLWPENSLLGFRNLCGLGADAVEFDIHQSADGELVVIHDPLLDRTAHDSGPVLPDELESDDTAIARRGRPSSTKRNTRPACSGT